MSTEAAQARAEEALARLAAAAAGVTMKLEQATAERDQLRMQLLEASASPMAASEMPEETGGSAEMLVLQREVERAAEENAELMDEVRRLTEKLTELEAVQREGDGGVRAELVRTRAEYSALDRSFQLLKSQYLKLQAQADQAAFGLPLLGAAQDKTEADGLRAENEAMRAKAQAAADDLDRLIASLAAKAAE